MGDESTTKPTMETLLARMNELGAELSERMNTFESNVNARFDAVDSRFDALESRLEQFETRTAKSLQAIEDQLGVLALDTVKLRAARGDMERRLSAIEERPA
jgi:hypothetical protein